LQAQTDHYPEEALLVVGAVVTPVLEAGHPEFAEQIIFKKSRAIKAQQSPASN
jgi:hypothetical protein